VWGVVGGCGGCGGVGVVSPCVRTFQGLHSVRLWTPTIFLFFIDFLKGWKILEKFVKTLPSIRQSPFA
jgi:hypothetical protein